MLALVLGGCSCSGDDGPDLTFGNTPPPVDATGDGDDATEDVDEPDPGPPDIAEVEDTAPDTTDAEPEVEVEDVPVDTGPPEPEGPDYLLCDAGDEAWVKAVLPALLGRKPKGIREVRVLVDMIEQTDRATVARGLMNSEEFLTRWQAWFMDELRVNRVGYKTHNECYGPAMNPDDDGEIAATIRDTPALEPSALAVFNLTDVLLSSLKLDDVSPLYRAHLFAMMAKPLTGANVGAIAMDITRRQDFGEIFESIYLHRNTVCAGCHNSKFGATDSTDPEKDLHFPLPGLVERAVYGIDSGRPEMEVYSIFRHLGIVRESGGLRPWGMHQVCGRFQNPLNVAEDPAKAEFDEGFSAFFLEDQGLYGSVWDTESNLYQGFQKLRATGFMAIDEETQEVDPQEAFAYMVSVRIANRVWREVLGYPLTLVHYIPRNAEQRDILKELTDHFVVEQWSLRTLLVDIVTHPLFNDNAPVDGCAPETGNPYIYPPVFNPWVLEEELEEERNANSVGDVMHRYDARMLLGMVNKALTWAPIQAYPDGAQESFQKSVGVFIKDGEPGFDGVDFQGLLTYESAYGACVGVKAGASDPNSCVGNCGGQATGGCWCDDQCAGFGDCCEDHESVCINGEVPEELAPIDWVDALENATEEWQEANPDLGLAISDVAIAMKDRLLTAPDIDPVVEGGFIADLFQVDSIATKLADAPDWKAGVRRYCGVLLETPQFLLAGVPGPDQNTLPKLVVANAAYQPLCEELTGIVFDAADWTVECGEDSVQITKVEPEPAPEPEPEPGG